jgi:predicted metal-dependent phosphoesterase TrpH
MYISADDSIDLQIHTIYSDGHWQPLALFEHLARTRFRVVSITDHDTMEHLPELRVVGAEHGVHVIPGVEMTTAWHGNSAHLLCYAAEFTGDALARLAHETEAAQLANTRAVYDTLVRSGYDFRMPHDAPARPIDNARLLHAHGYAATMDDALQMIADVGYQSITTPLVDAVAAAHASGAVAILAHPGRGGGEIHRYDLPLLAELLTDIALDGIEVRYPNYSAEQIEAYTTFARQRSLLASAGSDSHGPNQRLPITYPASLCADLLLRCGVRLR